MPRPLQSGDPPRLGPFRIRGRLRESPAGIVYLGEDPYGMHVSVALLTKGAAGDPAARDRFRTAITGEMATSTGVPRAPGSWTEGATAPLVAAYPDSPAPWVATVHDTNRPGAERFLEPVLFKTGPDEDPKGGDGGPRFEPYWVEARDPAKPPMGFGRRGGERGLFAAVLTLGIVLLLLALAMTLLYACVPQSPQPTPTPSPVPTTGRSSPSPTPSPVPTPSSPGPSQSGTPRSPSPSGTGSGPPV
jgi:hypothetical protein